MDDIVLFQILPRLPARSIGRFRSVCKQWHSFLTTPVFTKMHLHHVNSENCHKLLVFSKSRPCKYFCTMDYETPEDGLTAIRSLPFEANYNQMWIISSLNGLVCIGIDWSRFAHEYAFSDIILWNPLMGDYKRLSKSKRRFSGAAARVYGLYYSSCDDDYRLLRITESNKAYIYSWKSDSWRKAKSRVDRLRYIATTSSNLLNGKLHFLAIKGTGGSIKDWSYLIIRFDTKTEMFTDIAIPFSKCLNLTVISGCIHLCVVPEGDFDMYELWKMDGDGKWTKVVRFSNLVCRHQPWHLMKNGNWLLRRRHNVHVYELDPEMLKEANEVWRSNIGDDTMTILPGGKFVETIVSLKR